MVLLLVFQRGFALADEPDYAPGPWHFKAVSCVDTLVLSVTPRLATGGTPTAHDFAETGVVVDYVTGLGVAPLFGNAHAGIVTYGGDAANTVMADEHPGDRVQVCFLGGPAPTTHCNPDKDSRGRRYRVYDYKQRRQYSGSNAEHDCGGA